MSGIRPPAPGLPPWPEQAPAHGRVALRRVLDGDVPLARELSTDPSVPTVGSLPARATEEQALAALTALAWTVPGLYRVALYIEPWNTPSLRTAEHAGYVREGLLRSHQEIGRGRRRDMELWAAVRETGPAQGPRPA
ncbi:GNAT family protein [Zafaria sp. Z1313]|uniref:GNAT family N-acetyltransferase n=1 Tax=unclassified Zafaria TaxID=2828765 RepID=UPI002E79FCC2|nr:GNAT family protein [Zafaria sp. J156]MEE1622118.1 GNAT family protein [Zafaria sp. J156]